MKTLTFIKNHTEPSHNIKQTTIQQHVRKRHRERRPRLRGITRISDMQISDGAAPRSGPRGRGLGQSPADRAKDREKIRPKLNLSRASIRSLTFIFTAVAEKPRENRRSFYEVGGFFSVDSSGFLSLSFMGSLFEWVVMVWIFMLLNFVIFFS